MYTIVFSEDAKKDLKDLHKKAPQALTKLAKFWMSFVSIPVLERDKSKLSRGMTAVSIQEE